MRKKDIIIRSKQMEATFICILLPLDGSAMILKCFGKTIFLRAREIKLFHQKSSCLWDCLHVQDLNQIGIAWKKCLILEFSGMYFPSFGIKPEIYWIQSFFLDLFFVFGLNMNQKKNSNSDTFHTVRVTEAAIHTSPWAFSCKFVA